MPPRTSPHSHLRILPTLGSDMPVAATQALFLDRAAKNQIHRHRSRIKMARMTVVLINEAEGDELLEKGLLGRRQGPDRVRPPHCAVGELKEEGKDLVAGSCLVRDHVGNEAPDLKMDVLQQKIDAGVRDAQVPPSLP